MRGNGQSLSSSLCVYLYAFEAQHGNCFKLRHVSCKTGPGYIFSGVQCELASVATSTKEMLFDACRIYMQRAAKQSGHELVNGCRCM